MGIKIYRNFGYGRRTAIYSSRDRRYELYLENGKVLKPTGNHPFLTEGNGWATIDGHVLNSAGGNGYIKIGDYVKDIDDGWVKVKYIISIDGEYLTYDFKNEYKTIIADGIITHIA